MGNAVDRKLNYPRLLWFILFGAAFGALMLVAEDLSGFSLPSWLKAVVLAGALIAFVLVYRRFRKGFGVR